MEGCHGKERTIAREMGRSHWREQCSGRELSEGAMESSKGSTTVKGGHVEYIEREKLGRTIQRG